VNYFPICGGWINNSSTVLHANHVLKNSPSFVKIAFTYSYSRKLRYKKGKIYRATADPLDESLSFSPVMGLAALEPIFKVSRQACVNKGILFTCHERKSFIRKL
jgi:hypothetical protein